MKKKLARNRFRASSVWISRSYVSLVAIVVMMTVVAVIAVPAVRIVRAVVAIVGIRPVVAVRIVVSIRIIPIIARKSDPYSDRNASVGTLRGDESQYPCHQSNQEKFFPVHCFSSYLLNRRQKGKFSGLFGWKNLGISRDANALPDLLIRNVAKA